MAACTTFGPRRGSDYRHPGAGVLRHVGHPRRPASAEKGACRKGEEQKPNREDPRDLQRSERDSIPLSGAGLPSARPFRIERLVAEGEQGEKGLT